MLGVVVKIVGLISKPELNGTFGTVVDFVDDTGRYNVQLLSARTATKPSLKPENIEIVNPPYTKTMKSVDIPAGRGNLIIIQDLDTDVVEINDLALQMVTCVQGKILFRRCHFSGVFDCGVGLGGGGGNSHVTFENCVFEGCRGSGVIVDNSATATGAAGFAKAGFITPLRETTTSCTMLNCVLRNNGVYGAEVRNEGVANFVHCRFIGNGKAQIIAYIKASITVVDCEIVGVNDSGILVMENARATISKTKISGPKIAGVAIQQKGVVDVRDCVISDCECNGILAQTGENVVTAVNCHIVRNSMGVHVAIDCLGTFTMEGNIIEGNKMRNIENNSKPDKCKVIVNGVLFRPNGITYHAEVANPSKGQAWRETEVYKKGMEAKMEELGAKDDKMATMKARKKAGLTTDVPICGQCQTIEPEDVNFQLCARCREVMYCSVDCQKRYWPEHKASCKKKIKHPCFLDPTKSTQVDH